MLFAPEKSLKVWSSTSEDYSEFSVPGQGAPVQMHPKLFVWNLQASSGGHGQRTLKGFLTACFREKCVSRPIQLSRFLLHIRKVGRKILN